MIIFFDILNLRKLVYKIVIGTRYSKKRTAVGAAIQNLVPRSWRSEHLFSIWFYYKLFSIKRQYFLYPNISIRESMCKYRVYL